MIHQQELDQVCAAVAAGCSVLVLEEAGAGAGQVAIAAYDHFSGSLSCAVATYKGSAKLFFQHIAGQLDIPVETEPDDNGKTRPLTVDQLKDEIAQNVGDETLLILPEAKRLPASVRYWVEDLLSAGVRIVATAVVNPGRDIFLDLIEVELALPDDQMIRSTMQAEAQRQGLQLSESQLAALQPLAGRNSMLAKKVIRNEALGMRQTRPEHSQYLDISPLVLAALCLLGILRFVGLATGDRGLYIIGGIAVMLGLSLRYLGKIQGSKRRLGQ